MKNRVGGEWVVKPRMVAYAHAEGAPENSCSENRNGAGPDFLL